LTAAIIIDGRLFLQKKPETYLLNLFSGKSGLARRWQSCFEFHWQIIAGCGPLVKKKHKLRYNFNGLDTRYGVSGNYQIRNPNIEIRNKFEYLISKI
jgi:hypothetical protein